MTPVRPGGYDVPGTTPVSPSPKRGLERAEDLYHGFCWRLRDGAWMRQRVLYRRGQAAPVTFLTADSPEEPLFRLIDGHALEGPGLETVPSSRRFASEEDLTALLAGFSAERRSAVEQALQDCLRRGLLVWRESRAACLPGHFGDAVIQRNDRVKVVRQFSDLTLLWQTERFGEIPASVPLNDNPVLAVPAWVADAYEMLDGCTQLRELLCLLWLRHGTSRVTPDRLLSVLRRLGELGFLTPDSAARVADAPAPWPQDEWDFDVSLVQKCFINTDLPMYVLLELTARCTRACPYCYKVTHGQERDMADEDYLKDVVQKVIDAGVGYVTMLGGEPLLRRGLVFECVRRLKANNVYAKLITNGDLLDAETAGRLGALGLNKIELSLDGFTPEAGDRFRGKGSVESVEAALRNLESSGIPDIGLSITISSANYGDIVGNLSRFLERHPSLNKVYFSRYFEAHQTERVDGISELTPEQVHYLSEKIEAEWKPRFRNRCGFDMAVLDAGMCSCGRSLSVLTCEGHIKPCPFTHERGPRLEVDQTFRSLWHASFNPLRMEDKATCWARKVRNRVALTMAPDAPATPPPGPDPIEPTRSVAEGFLADWETGGGDMASALDAALSRGCAEADITAALHSLSRSDAGLRERTRSALLAASRASGTYASVLAAARSALRWLDVGSVVFVSPEAWPVSKGGGMASAVSGRAASLAAAGLKVSVITPLYTYTESGASNGRRERSYTKDDALTRAGLEYTGHVVSVPVSENEHALIALARGEVDGVEIIALDSTSFAEALYGYARAGTCADRVDGLARLVEGSFVLSLGALEAMAALGISPSAVVGNDWMCAPLASALTSTLADGDGLSPAFVAWVHNNGEDYQFRVNGAGLLTRTPIPVERHADFADPNDPDLLNFQAALLRLADYVVAVSPEQKDAYLEGDSVGGGDGLSELFRAKESAGLLFGIPNGLDVRALQKSCFGEVAVDANGVLPRIRRRVLEARDAAKRSLAMDCPAFWPVTGGKARGLGEDTFLVTMVTRITAQKGIDTVAAFTRRVLDCGAYPDVRFAFAGDGDEDLVDMLRLLARKYPGVVGYADRFLVEDGPDGLYRTTYVAGDLYIAFSRWEPGGLSVMEALAHGTPCLVSDCQGHRGTVRSITVPGSSIIGEPESNGARFPVSDSPETTISMAMAAFDTLYRTWQRRGQEPAWDALVSNALRSDNRWDTSLPAVEQLLIMAATR